MATAALQLLLLFALLQSIFAQSNEQDFSYMKSVKNATDMPLEAEYDYIIVGGGTAGCPLAATLSERYSVLVLERGGVPLDYPDVLNAAGFETILGLEDDGNTPSQGFTSEDGVGNARARILGGGSMINGAFYSRADQEFYGKSGIDWDGNLVHDSYAWVEETVAKKSDLYPWNSVVRDGLLQADVAPDNGFTLDHLLGTKVSASTFDGSGKRFGAVELLNKGNLSNLYLVVHATVDRIIFSSPKSSGISAKGVKYTDSLGRSHQAKIRSKGEVILSAGALGSPQLLMLSGVGPKSYLSSLNISVLLDQPYVGDFVYDNPCNVIAFTSPLPINSSFIQIVGITSNSTFIETRSNPGIALLFTKVGGTLLSAGSFSLASSTNVTVPPKVRYNYYSDPSDLDRCVDVIRKVGELLSTPSLDRFKTTNSTTGVRDYEFFGTAPPTNQSNDATVEDYCRSTVTTIWHYHGGCTVGKVVDGMLRAKGIRALRVVDGSTFTVSPGTNPQATLMMLGRYIGLGILKERMA